MMAWQPILDLRLNDDPDEKVVQDDRFKTDPLAKYAQGNGSCRWI